MRTLLIGLSLLLAACANEETNTEGTDATEQLAADTASLPDTDIYLADLSADGLAPEISNFRAAVTGPGYANQPYFVGNGSFLFTQEGADAKTDLWQFDIGNGEQTQRTDSADRSEYSPKRAPDGGLSYIQESPDAEMTWVHKDGAQVIAFAPLGYYEWLNGGETLGVFYRSDVPELHLVDVASGENTKIIAGVGRSLQAAPDGNTLYFTAKTDSGNQLYELAIGAAPRAILTMPSEGEDFRVVFNEAGLPLWIFASEGNDIRYHAYPDAPGETWPIVGLFPGVGPLSRIAISEDNSIIAIVAAVE